MSKLLRKVTYLCPFCDHEHEIEIREESTKVLIMDEAIEYDEIYYYCPIEQEEFYPKNIIGINVINSIDKYRKKHELLTSLEIKNIRDIYNLTQKEFSNLLGWGDITIQRYEKKAIQEETYDEKMKLVFSNPMFALEQLEKHKDKFELERFKQIYEIIKKRVNECSRENLMRESLKAAYLEYNEPSDFNGYKLLDMDKVDQMLRFFTQYNDRLYKVKLLKLLWYADSFFFKLYNRSMSGMVYVHYPLGAVPLVHDDLLEAFKSSININEEIIDECIAYRIENKKQVDLNKLDPKEITVLEKVNEKFKTFGSRKIMKYMHDEVAYTSTTDSQVIPYSLSMQIEL